MARRDHLEAVTGTRIPVAPMLEEEVAADGDEAEEDEEDETQEERLASIRGSYARFLDRPIPALLGMSLRQTAPDRQLHPVVLALLRDHEERIERLYGVGFVDFDAMRRELGLVH